MMSNLAESFTLTGQYLRRNLFLTVTAVLVMTLTFFATSLFLGAGAVANTLIGYLESKAQITIFFRNDAPLEKIMAIKENLENSGKVLEVDYLSQEDALKIYLGQHRDEPTLLESITANIFPASLEVRAKALTDLPQLAKDLEGEEGVEEVVYFRDVLETFRQWTASVRLAGLLLIGLLALISTLITLITIGMTIYSRGEEIEVMRLVGATEGYIRLPFILQGASYGVLAALLSAFLFLLCLPLALPSLERVLVGIPLEDLRLPVKEPLFLLQLFLAEIVFGVVLGVLGSLTAIRKYLSV